MVKNLPAVRETPVRSLGWEDPLEKGMATHSSTGLDCEGYASIFKPFHKIFVLFCAVGFPGGTSGKESTCQCRRQR